MAENTVENSPSDRNLAPGEYRVGEPATTASDASCSSRPHEKPFVQGEPAPEDTDLLPTSQCEAFNRRWSQAQAKFVDEPTDAVAEGDQLVNEVINAIKDGFSKRRGQLEKQWNSGAQASTEDLRITMQKYRSFFERLLSVSRT